jgi:hypothetical protein
VLTEIGRRSQSRFRYLRGIEEYEPALNRLTLFLN